MALTKSLRMGFSFKKQVDLSTALAAGDMWSLTGQQMDFTVEPKYEDNKDDLGTSVYVTQLYPTILDASGSWNGILTAENACMVANFFTGARTKTATTATGGFKYAGVQPDLFTSLDLPVATIVEQLADVRDIKHIGVALEEFSITISTAPSREANKFTSSWRGTGRNARPSSITMPAAYAEHPLNAVSILTLCGFDYLTLARWAEFTLTFKNNIRTGNAYGAFQGAHRVMDKMRRGVPEITLTGKVEMASGTSEEDNMLSGTTGTGTIQIDGAQIASGPEKYGLKVVLQKIITRATKRSDIDGIAAWDLDFSIMEHASNGVYAIDTIVTQDNVLA